MDIEFYKIELGKAISKISQLEKEIEQLKLTSTFGTPTDGLEVGSPEDYGEQPWIYESPDGGKTVYQRRAGETNRTKCENSKQLDLFEDNYNEGKQ
tara:strand:+ start:907 stop:1194 length:288 start_codon:yes stop_codon:yes gene_type:complete